MICQKCNATISDSAKFCPRCGTKVEMAKTQTALTKKCPTCGTENPLSAKFCKVDGYNFQQAAEKPAEKPAEPEKPKDIIICPKCGTPNPLTAKFCKKDGTPLKEEVKPPPVQPKVREVALPKAEVRKEAVRRPSRKWIWLTVSGLVLIIAGVGSYLYFSGQIGKKPTEVPAVPEVTKPPEPTRVPEEVEKPTIPQKPETEIVSPPMPAPEPSKPSIDIARIERDLNRTLRNRGLGDVYAEVNRDLTVTLKGTVNDPRDKMLASNITESFKEIKSVKNEIKVASIPPPPLPIDPAKLEGDINRALRNAGLRGVTAEVNDNLEVTLKGSVGSQYEKDRAFEIAKTFKEAKRIRDVIFVVEQ
jgi:osmotically-inducible protein OsmY/ribosomal protein L40E